MLFGWADSWSNVLRQWATKLWNIQLILDPVAKETWAQEYLSPGSEGFRFAQDCPAQVKEFKPEVLWFYDMDEKLCKKFERSSFHSIGFWAGVESAILEGNNWGNIRSHFILRTGKPVE